jgi:hypothetical protein
MINRKDMHKETLPRHSGSSLYPGYLKGLEMEDGGSRPSKGKMFKRPPSPPMSGYSGVCLLSQVFREAQIGELRPGQLRHKETKNNQSKKG